MKEALIRPFILAKEPVLMFANLYVGFVCQFQYYLLCLPLTMFYSTNAIFYLWFETFPLVFTDIRYFRLDVGFFLVKYRLSLNE